MNLMFWKKKKNAEGGAEETEGATDKTEVIAPTSPHEPESEAAELTIKRIKNKKRLILGAMAGGGLLLLIAIGVTAWILLSGSDEKAEPPIAADQHETTPAEEQDKTLQTQFDELKEQNAKLAAELEAAKKNTGMEYQDNNEANQNDEKPSKNEIIFSGQDPKASAQALKEAIEQMNTEDSKESR